MAPDARTDLAIPTTRELQALAPADRWELEDRLDQCQDLLREFNDEELRRWVEDEGKTQVEIADLVGRQQPAISKRCQRLGIAASSKRGRPRNIPGNKSEVLDPDPEVFGTENPPVIEAEDREGLPGPQPANGPEPPKIETTRQRNVAERNKHYAEAAVGTCSDLARGLNAIRIEDAMAVASEEEINGWAEVFQEAGRALTQMRKRIKGKS